MSSDLTVEIFLTVDDEHKDYTVEYTIQTVKGRISSETCIIFNSLKEAVSFVAHIKKVCRKHSVPCNDVLEIL